MATLTAELTGADPGLLGTLTVEVRQAADDVIVTPATTDGVEDLGGGTYRYTAELAAGDYIVHWDVGAPGTAEDGSAVEDAQATPPAGLAYAAPVDLRARLELTDAELTDAAATRLLERAERRLDRLAGAWPIRPNGRKFDPAGLPSLYSTTIREATLDLAEAEQRNPDAYTPPAAGTISGPDFTLTNVSALPSDGKLAIRDAVDRLDVLNLRALTARARP
jgi:hypothetical protein